MADELLAEVTEYIERAEQIVRRAGGPIMRLPPLHRRRLLAEAVFEELRPDRQPPEPAYARVPRR